MNFEYYEGWHRFYHEAIGKLSIKKAKQRHIKKKSYCVVVTKNDTPIAFIEINLGFFSVNFLDIHRRVFLTYGFNEVDEKRLFLSQAFYTEFSSEEGDVRLSGTNYYFKENGFVSIEQVDQYSNISSVMESKNQQDLLANWEAKPGFGEYSNLVRKERSEGVILHKKLS